MNTKTLSIIGMFTMSIIVGRQLLPNSESVQAAPVTRYVEMPRFPNLPNVGLNKANEENTMDTINIDVDLSTLETSVKGLNNAIVSVNTTNAPTPKIKWKTKVIEKHDTIEKHREILPIPFYELKSMDNKIILKQMVRLSGIIKDLKSARAKLALIQFKTDSLIVNGNVADSISKRVDASIMDCLYTEQCLRLSVSNACKCLDGFDESLMEPIDYISSSDIKNKFVDICSNGKVVATIKLATGEIKRIKEPELEMAE